MKTYCKNIYKLCREAAWTNQDVAADLLGVSIRSLSDYETGKTIPPEDVVCRMVEIYNSPILAYMHLKTNNEVGRRFLPEIRVDNLSEAVLRLQMNKHSLDSIEPQIVQIACDGIIDENEIPIWTQVRTEMEQMASSVMSLLFIPEKRERPLKAAL